MPIITKIVEWTFPSNVQNWVGTAVGTNAAMGYSVISASLSASITMNNTTVRTMTGSWSYTGSWASILNYTAGEFTRSRVIGVSASYRWQCPRISSTATTNADGPFLLKTGSTTIGTFAAATTFNTRTGWTYKSGSFFTTANTENLSASLIIALSCSLRAAGGSGQQTLNYQDNIGITASIEELYTIRHSDGFFFLLP
jgi:hypothetical protein